MFVFMMSSASLVHLIRTTKSVALNRPNIPLLLTRTILLSSQLQLRTPFLRPKGVRLRELRLCLAITFPYLEANVPVCLQFG